VTQCNRHAPPDNRQDGRASIRHACWTLAALALLCCGPPPVEAAIFDMPIGTQPGEQTTPQKGAEQQQKEDQQNPEAKNKGEQGEPSFLLGGLLDDFHKWRQSLKDKGITLSLHERSEVWADISGGGHQGVSYTGLTTAKLNVDLDAVLGWSGGEFFASAFDIHGHGPTRSFVGNQQLVSNLEGTPSIKLYDLWLDQTLFDKKLSIRVGQEGAGDEMMTTAYGAVFLNSSFGFPGMPASDLPSGGPNYPLAGPFTRVLYSPVDKVTIVGAVYTADPAPPGIGNPQVRDRNGTAFRLNDHTMAFGEVWYSPDSASSDNLPTTYKIGSWYATNNFADQRFDSAGGLLASPTSTGAPLNHTGDWAIYGVIDQKVWQNPDSKNQGIGVFLQIMGGPGDRNLSNFFAEAGVSWQGPFKDRADDMAGLGVSYLGISPALRRFSNDLVAVGRATTGYASNETVIEATYSAPITSWLTLQPDIQYAINPNAGIPSNFGRAPLSNALVIGMRATFKL
jgi:porin